MSGIYIQTIFADFIAQHANRDSEFLNENATQRIIDQFSNYIFTTGHEPADANYSFTTGRRSLHVTNTGFYKVRFNLNYDDENPENIEAFDYVVSVEDASYFKHVSNGKWLALNEIEKNYIIFNQLNNEFVENYLP